jgi:hypothetical protein
MDEELEGLKHDVRTWLEMDNTIRALQATLRERKEAKRALTSRILAFMASRNVDDLATRQGDRLTFRVSYVRAPLTHQAIRTRLLGSNALNTQQVDEVFGNRERNERTTLRRILPQAFPGAARPQNLDASA